MTVSVQPDPPEKIKRREAPPRPAPPLLPALRRGARLGLFGGSFDPAHEGHLAVAQAARRACRLDAVLWLVTPGNPLKATQRYAPLPDRMAGARRLAGTRPWLHVSGIEAGLGTRYTIDTVTALLARRPDLSMVWIMGADSLAGFHRWRNWEWIACAVPMLVVSRPGHALSALQGRAARTLGPHRLPPAAAPRLPTARPPAWVYLPGISVPISSTAIRTRDAAAPS